MTIHIPDASPFQGGLSFAGAPAACLKTTEGTGWSSGAWFPAAVGRAKAAGAFTLSYHFLHGGNPGGQAAWAHAHCAGLPLMVDVEPTGASRPGLQDACAFVDEFRRAGGVCALAYFPQWYWSQIGSPSLGPLTQRGVALWSSAYTSYSDTGSGWHAYGGASPALWQWTDKAAFNGQHVDMSAFRGTLAELKALACGGKVPPADPHPVLRRGDSGDAVKRMQTRLNTWGAARPPLTADGAFGPATGDALRQFQKTRGLVVDEACGPATWTALEASPNPPPPKTDPPVTGRFHGEYVTGGMFSLDDLGKKLGVTPNGLIRMTATHYGTLGDVLGDQHLGGILKGTVPWSKPVPKGVTLWVD